MAPRPIDEIDFPALRDEIVELLLALWAFVCDLCIALWSCISQAFWNVWTYPPFEAFRSEFAAAFIALSNYVVAHPFITIAILILTHIIVLVVLSALEISLLYCLGFRERSILHGSYVTNYQSTSHGGNVPRGPTFTRFQSQRRDSGGGARGYRAVGGMGSPSWN